MYFLMFTFLQYIAIKWAKVRFYFICFYLFILLQPSIQVKGKTHTHTPIGPTCGRIWHLVMTCCLCRKEMSETQAICFMNEYLFNTQCNAKFAYKKRKSNRQ